MQPSASLLTSSRPPLTFIPVSMPSVTQSSVPVPFRPDKSKWGQPSAQTQGQGLDFSFGMRVTLRGTSQAHRFDMSVFKPFAKDEAELHRPGSALARPLTWSSEDPSKVEEERVLQAAKLYHQDIEEAVRRAPINGNYRDSEKVNGRMIRDRQLTFQSAKRRLYSLFKKADLQLISATTIPWAGFVGFLRRSDLYQGYPEETCSPFPGSTGSTGLALGDRLKSLLIHQYPVFARLLTFSMDKASGVDTTREQTISVSSLWKQNNLHDYGSAYAALVPSLLTLSAKYFSHLLPEPGQELLVEISACFSQQSNENLTYANQRDDIERSHHIINTITNEIYLTFTNPRNDEQVARVPLAFESGQLLTIFDSGSDADRSKLQKDIKPLQTVVTQWPLDARWNFRRDAPGQFTPIWSERSSQQKRAG